MPYVYGYSRVSHKDSLDGFSLAAQESRIRSHFESLKVLNPKLEFGGMFVDEAVSAFKKPFLVRPAGAMLNAKLRSGDIVLVLRMDRIFRRIKDALVTVDVWAPLGVRLRFCDSDVDTGTASGRFFFQVLAIVSEWESAVKSERIREGLARLRIQNCKRDGSIPNSSAISVVGKNIAEKYGYRTGLVILRLMSMHQYRVKNSSVWPDGYTKIRHLLHKHGYAKAVRDENTSHIEPIIGVHLNLLQLSLQRYRAAVRKYGRIYISRSNEWSLCHQKRKASSKPKHKVPDEPEQLFIEGIPESLWKSPTSTLRQILECKQMYCLPRHLKKLMHRCSKQQVRTVLRQRYGNGDMTAMAMNRNGKPLI
jgi:DNA invertase Pin-like site-specific DNA recombinase